MQTHLYIWHGQEALIFQNPNSFIEIELINITLFFLSSVAFNRLRLHAALLCAVPMTIYKTNQMKYGWDSIFTILSTNTHTWKKKHYKWEHVCVNINVYYQKLTECKTIGCLGIGCMLFSVPSIRLEFNIDTLNTLIEQMHSKCKCIASIQFGSVRLVSFELHTSYGL